MSGIQRQIRNADTLPRFELNPEALSTNTLPLAVVR